MSWMERVKQHDSRTARWIVAVAAVLLLALGLWSLAGWIGPNYEEKRRVIARACFDAGELHEARLLDQARRAYRAIRLAHGADARCAYAAGGITGDQTAAALQRGQGTQYMRASKGLPPDSDQRERARNAFRRSLAIDPYQEQARRDLNAVLAAWPPPGNRGEANDRCELGGVLREAGLLPEAMVVYAQALSAGHHSTCTRNGLRLTRLDIAQAQRTLLEAKTLAAEGRADDVIRRKYVEALAIDSSLADAWVALDDHPALDPREGTLMGRLELMIADAVDWLGGAVDWLAERVHALAFAAVAALLVLLLAMVVLMFLTRAKFVRGGLRWIPPLRRFIRPRILIAAFTPAEQASGSEAMFAKHLKLAPIRKDVSAELVATDASDLPQDVVRSREVANDPLEQAATLIAAFPQVGVVADTVRYLANAAPRWDVRVRGQLMDPAAQGHGLYVEIAARGGRPGGESTFWASDLPGPRFSDEEATAARYALAIMAAAWAHETINR